MIPFVVLSLVMIASAIFTVTAKKPVYSVVGLLLNFIALAVTYLTLHAEFLGGDADHRVQRRDPGVVSVRNRAAFERDEALRGGSEPDAAGGVPGGCSG